MDVFTNWISNPVNSENKELTKELTEEELKAIELVKAKRLENYL